MTVHMDKFITNMTQCGDTAISIDIFRYDPLIYMLAMHWLTAASRPRLSETEPKLFELETS